jgi:hypothetical protein
MFENFYLCPRCDKEWQDEWDCQCDDDCPYCELRHISPYKSEDIIETDNDDKSRRG